MKHEVKTLLVTAPAKMKEETNEGYLIVKVKMHKEIPEDVKGKYDREEIEAKMHKDADGYMVIDTELHVGKLTNEDIVGCGPADYLENGIVAGILDAIRHGLGEDRGINIKYAVEDAEKKAESALQCVQGVSILDQLAELSLAVSEPKGSA